jgi:hypothetical protein
MATPIDAKNTATQMFFAMIGGYFKHSVGSYPELLR